MKKYKYLFLLTFLFTMTSCLKGNLDDLPEFEDNDITGVQRVEYRYISNDVSGASGQPVTKFISLGQSSTVDKTQKSVKVKVTVPAANTSSFPESERNKCDKGNIAVMVSLSTAARIAPVGDSPKMGVPGNWTKANKYIVTAANGSTAEWTIEITDFIK